jgi:hypothetical protein
MALTQVWQGKFGFGHRAQEMGEKCFAGTCVYSYDVLRKHDIERLRVLVQRFSLTEARRKVQYEELHAAVLGSAHCYSSEAEAAPSTMLQSPEHANRGNEHRQQPALQGPPVLRFALTPNTVTADNPPVTNSGFVVRGGVKRERPAPLHTMSVSDQKRYTTTMQMPEDALNPINKFGPRVKIRRTITGGQRLGNRERDCLPSVGAEKLSRAMQELAHVA